MYRNLSRRLFLERLSIGSAILTVSPTALFAKSTKNLLKVLLLGEDLEFLNVINKSEKASVTTDLKLASVIYLSAEYNQSCEGLRMFSDLGKHLIIEGTKNNSELIKSCKSSGSSLTIVERLIDGSSLFSSAIYYEKNTSQIANFKQVVNILEFLEQHTTPMKFFIKSH